MSYSSELILLASFSGRMLAELAVKAGYPVLALDYFGDYDLQQLCQNVSLRHNFNADYSAQALVDAAQTLPGLAVVYGASLENHPAEVARLAKNRQLLGNSPESLKRVRDPFLLAETLKAGGFTAPETRPAESPPANHSAKRWLWKSLHGGGGIGVEPWKGAMPSQSGILQEWLPGMVGSVAFVANGEQAVLLGITEQLSEREPFYAPGYKYCGNLMPPRLPAKQLARLVVELRALAGYITRTFGLQGINGVDFVWHNKQVWTIEVNPRISASLELMDRLYSIDSFTMHVQAFSGQLPAFDLPATLATHNAVGKAIIYAPYELTVGDTSQWSARGIKDVPHSGEQILQGQPVCTILTEGNSSADCLHKLKLQAAGLIEEFQPFAIEHN